MMNGDCGYNFDGSQMNMGMDPNFMCNGNFNGQFQNCNFDMSQQQNPQEGQWCDPNQQQFFNQNCNPDGSPCMDMGMQQNCGDMSMTNMQCNMQQNGMNMN